MCLRLLASPQRPFWSHLRLLPVSQVSRNYPHLSRDPEDVVTLRARVIRFRYLMGKESTDADNVFATLRRLVERISDPCASEKEIGNSLKESATLFTSAHTSMSSFELLQSGVMDGLLQFATDTTRSSTRSSIHFVRPSPS